MNKARKKRNKDGFATRLVSESFVLSLTRKLSQRFVRFFEYGIASPILNSAKSVDSFLRKKITGPIFKKLDLRENFSMPARNAIASFFVHNPIMKAASAIQTGFLNTSVRSVGVFLLTFAVYSAALFMLKSYVSVGFGSAASINDISVAAVALLIGLLFIAFGDKTLLNTVGNSKIIGSLLSSCLGVNDSSFARYKNSTPKTAVAVAFLCGSALGIATLFFTPLSVLVCLAAALTVVAIMNVAEFGLLLAMSTFSFLPLNATVLICTVTLLSYLLKCVRLKRNLRFGTADAVVFLALAAVFVGCLVTDGGLVGGEYYILCFTALYFVAKNLLCSEKLVTQAFDALCLGASVGMALYIFGDFATLIPHGYLREAAVLLTCCRLEPEMLVAVVATLLPFALSSFSSVGNRKPREFFLLSVAVCAVLTDSSAFYLLALVSLFVYVAFAYKAPFGSLLGAAAVIPPVAVYTFEHTVSRSVRLGTALSYDSSLVGSQGMESGNLWYAMYNIGGGVAVLLFFAAIVLILQRLLGVGVGESGTKRSLFIGTAASSAVMFTVCSFSFNLFYDLRIYAVMIFVLGLCGAVYKTVSVAKRAEEV